jgi:hypothetical protein
MIAAVEQWSWPMLRRGSSTARLARNNGPGLLEAIAA